MSVAFVLQGGGSFGAAQAGMLVALAEAGIVPDLIVGSSAGALNGAMFANGGDLGAAVLVRELWLGIRRKDVFPLRPRPLIKGIFGRGDGLVEATALHRFIVAHLPYQRLEQAPIPVHVVATEVSTGNPVVMSTGDAASALVASTAIPGVFPPVLREGRWLMDGSISADLPVSIAADLGAAVVYALPTALNLDPHPRGALAMMQRATDVLIERATATLLAGLAGVTVHLMPTPAATVTTLDFSTGVALAHAGHRSVTDWLRSRSAGDSERAPTPVAD